MLLLSLVYFSILAKRTFFSHNIKKNFIESLTLLIFENGFEETSAPSVENMYISEYSSHLTSLSLKFGDDQKIASIKRKYLSILFRSHDAKHRTHWPPVLNAHVCLRFYSTVLPFLVIALNTCTVWNLSPTFLYTFIHRSIHCYIESWTSIVNLRKTKNIQTIIRWRFYCSTQNQFHASHYQRMLILNFIYKFVAQLQWNQNQSLSIYQRNYVCIGYCLAYFPLLNMTFARETVYIWDII